MKKNVNGVDVQLTDSEEKAFLAEQAFNKIECSLPQPISADEKAEACFEWCKAMYDAKVCKCECLEQAIKKDDEYKAHNG